MEDNNLRVERKLAGQQQLLRVAAGQRPGPGVQPGRANVERFHHCARLGIDTAPVDSPPLPERRLADALEEDVECYPEIADDPLTEPVIGHVAEPESLPGRDAQAVDSDAEQLDRPRCDPPLSGDGFGQRALAVAVYARDA